MKFPYPENLSDWQTAYTRDDAYQDSSKYATRSSLVGLMASISILALIALIAVPKINQTITLLLTKILSNPVVLPNPFVKTIIFIVILVVLYTFVQLLMSIVRKRARYFAATFFTEFYQPPKDVDPIQIMDYRLYGKSKLPPPFNMLSQFEYIMARDGEIVKSDQWPAWCARHLGGPILLIVFDGCALYLERGNRFSRVVGPGDKAPFLEWYETIKYVVDLRPKIKDGGFDVWTKDGININLTIQIECRIGDPQKKDADSNLVYPYDPISVKKAIERHSTRWPNRTEGDPSEFTWVDAAWGQVTGIVPGYIGSRMLDDLFMESRKSGQILSPEAVREIFDKLNNATMGFGVYITDFQVLEIKLPKEVEYHQKEFWKAERQSIATKIDGEARAFNIRAREKTRADAQYDIILAIAEGLEKHQDGKFTEPLLLSLSGVLDESLSEPLTRAYLARETLDTLEKLKDMLENPSA